MTAWIALPYSCLLSDGIDSCVLYACTPSDCIDNDSYVLYTCLLSDGIDSSVLYACLLSDGIGGCACYTFKF